MMPSALFITGGWDGHEPNQCAKIFIDFLKSKGWQVQVSGTLDILLDSKIMQQLSLLVPVWTMGELPKPQSKALQQAIYSGVGMAGWHGGMCDAFHDDTQYQFITGGQWVAHPGNILKYTVNVRQDSDGLMVGLKDFQMESEQYYMHVDPGNEVLATTTFTGEYGDAKWIAGTVMPVIWKKMYGKGRIFYTSLGHLAKDFDVPEAREIVKRGLQWAGREPVVAEYQSK